MTAGRVVPRRRREIAGGCGRGNMRRWMGLTSCVESFDALGAVTEKEAVDGSPLSMRLGLHCPDSRPWSACRAGPDVQLYVRAICDVRVVVLVRYCMFVFLRLCVSVVCVVSVVDGALSRRVVCIS